MKLETFSHMYLIHSCHLSHLLHKHLVSIQKPESRDAKIQVITQQTEYLLFAWHCFSIGIGP